MEGNGSRERALPLEMKLKVGDNSTASWSHDTGVEKNVELRISPKCPRETFLD